MRYAPKRPGGAGVVPPSPVYLRLLPEVDEALRSRSRYKGDLSRMIEESLMSPDIDLMTIRTMNMTEVLLSERPITPTLSDKCRRLLKRVSTRRGESMNAIANAAVTRMLKLKVKE